MSNEELMKPRYKVIADWPGVAGKVRAGDILHMDDEFIEGLYWVGGEQFMKDKLDDYPHLFKPLDWWEERTMENMPMYLRCTQSPDMVHVRNEVYKVSEYKTPYWAIGESGHMIINTNCYIPTTEAEYLEQNTTI